MLISADGVLLDEECDEEYDSLDEYEKKLNDLCNAFQLVTGGHQSINTEDAAAAGSKKEGGDDSSLCARLRGLVDKLNEVADLLKEFNTDIQQKRHEIAEQKKEFKDAHSSLKQKKKPEDVHNVERKEKPKDTVESGIIRINGSKFPVTEEWEYRENKLEAQREKVNKKNLRNTTGCAVFELNRGWEYDFQVSAPNGKIFITHGVIDENTDLSTAYFVMDRKTREIRVVGRGCNDAIQWSAPYKQETRAVWQEYGVLNPFVKTHVSENVILTDREYLDELYKRFKQASYGKSDDMYGFLRYHVATQQEYQRLLDILDKRLDDILYEIEGPEDNTPLSQFLGFCCTMRQCLIHQRKNDLFPRDSDLEDKCKIPPLVTVPMGEGEVVISAAGVSEVPAPQGIVASGPASPRKVEPKVSSEASAQSMATTSSGQKEVVTSTSDTSQVPTSQDLAGSGLASSRKVEPKVSSEESSAQSTATAWTEEEYKELISFLSLNPRYRAALQELVADRECQLREPEVSEDSFMSFEEYLSRRNIGSSGVGTSAPERDNNSSSSIRANVSDASSNQANLGDAHHLRDSYEVPVSTAAGFNFSSFPDDKLFPPDIVSSNADHSWSKYPTSFSDEKPFHPDIAYAYNSWSKYPTASFYPWYYVHPKGLDAATLRKQVMGEAMQNSMFNSMSGNTSQGPGIPHVHVGYNMYPQVPYMTSHVQPKNHAMPFVTFPGMCGYTPQMCGYKPQANMQLGVGQRTQSADMQSRGMQFKSPSEWFRPQYNYSWNTQKQFEQNLLPNSMQNEQPDIQSGAGGYDLGAQQQMENTEPIEQQSASMGASHVVNGWYTDADISQKLKQVKLKNMSSSIPRTECSTSAGTTTSPKAEQTEPENAYESLAGNNYGPPFPKDVSSRNKMKIKNYSGLGVPTSHAGFRNVSWSVPRTEVPNSAGTTTSPKGEQTKVESGHAASTYLPRRTPFWKKANESLRGNNYGSSFPRDVSSGNKMKMNSSLGVPTSHAVTQEMGNSAASEDDDWYYAESMANISEIIRDAKFHGQRLKCYSEERRIELDDKFMIFFHFLRMFDTRENEDLINGRDMALKAVDDFLKL